MSRPRQTGWYWFLPDEKCPTPTGLLRLDKPVVLLVGADKVTRDGPPAKFVVRFPFGDMLVDDMTTALVERLQLWLATRSLHRKEGESV